MCGRFSLATSKEKTGELFPETTETEPLSEHYNIAPTQLAAVITNERPDIIQHFHWGLVPSWAKSDKPAGLMINARVESIFEKPAFSDSILHRRCLVLADSFYEWRLVGKNKVPYRILPVSGQLMVMAGIWDTWRQGQEKIHTFAIITTPANQEVSTLHNRMPLVLLDREDQEKWLQPIPREDIERLLQPPPDGIFRLYRVSERLNSVANDDARLHLEVPEMPTLF